MCKALKTSRLKTKVSFNRKQNRYTYNFRLKSQTQIMEALKLLKHFIQNIKTYRENKALIVDAYRK